MPEQGPEQTTFIELFHRRIPQYAAAAAGSLFCVR